MHKILLVDDETIVLTQLENQLSAMGYRVTGKASTGQEAVVKAKKLLPDLILMDIMMHKGSFDGIMAAKAIRTQFDIPVIFLTAHVTEKLIKQAKKANPFGYILKPFQDKELKAGIEIALYKKEQERILYKSKKDLIKNIFELNNIIKEKSSKLSKFNKVINRKKALIQNKNTALKEILTQVEIKKKEIENHILVNIEKALLPELFWLKKRFSGKNKKHIDLIINLVKEITNSFLIKLKKRHKDLSPMEFRICNMIKKGFTSKEIAQILFISHRTVDKHRNNIRKKIDIIGKSVNLTSYLNSFQD